MGGPEEEVSISRTQVRWTASAQRNRWLGTNLDGWEEKVRADVSTLTCRRMQRAKNGMSIIARMIIGTC